MLGALIRRSPRHLKYWGKVYTHRIPYQNNHKEINNMLCRQVIKRCLLVLLVLGLAACKKYDISAPVADSLYTAAPPQFVVTYKAQPSSLPAMTLNGFTVTDHFTAEATQATAPGSELQARPAA